MEVINSYAEQTWVKVRTCRHAKCSGDNWEPAHYDDCWDKITSNSSAKVRLDKAVQYVVFSCTGIASTRLSPSHSPNCASAALADPVTHLAHGRYTQRRHRGALQTRNRVATIGQCGLCATSKNATSTTRLNKHNAQHPQSQMPQWQIFARTARTTI